MKQSTSRNDPPRESHTPAEAVGSCAVEVPALLGSEPQTAVDRIRELGLLPVVESQEIDDETLVGVVCGQHPAAGTGLPAGAVVLLLIGQNTVAEQAPPAAEFEPIDEDGWFDVELPDVDQSFQNLPSGLGNQNAQTEAAMSHAAGPPAGRTGQSRGSQRRTVVASAIALAVMVLLAVALRSCGEPKTASPPLATGPPHERRSPGPMPVRRRRQRAGPVVSMPERQRPSHHRTTRHRGEPLPSAPPTQFRAGPDLRHVSAPASPIPDACEFCLERPSP